MSKSILVIDTPENCYNCGIRRGYSCGGVSGTFGVGKTIEDFKLHKPDWCPLISVPQRKKSNFSDNDFEIGKKCGYNNFIDEILKGAS